MPKPSLLDTAQLPVFDYAAALLPEAGVSAILLASLAMVLPVAGATTTVSS